ncbi:MAG: NAD(P)H-hydrate dehydratase, partial [Dehalococcoidia bacterium]
AMKLSEATFLPLADEDGFLTKDAAPEVIDELSRCDVLLAGCGLSQRSSVQALLEAVLFDLPQNLKGAVLDADALNYLAGVDGWWKRLRPGCVLTPHPGEMARLTGKTVADVQAARLATASDAAAAWQQTVVLKGAGTIVAAPDGRAWLSPFSTAALASGGTGDVLAGLIAALIAQGLAAPEAACCGVFLHGTAGDLLRKELGDAGVLASDVLAALPRARQEVLGLSVPAPSFGMGGMGGLGNLGGFGGSGGGGGGLQGLGGLPGGLQGLGGLGAGGGLFPS